MDSLYIVGDIHGCADELELLLDAVSLKAGDTILFLGDYVDRGPASADVIGLLVDLRQHSPAQTIFLKGNHEAMFLSYLGYDGLDRSVFFENGGAATLASYGLAASSAGADAARAIPAGHLEFLRGLSLTYLSPPFLAVHAGIDPDRSLEEQSETDLLWIRERFTQRRHELPYTVCFGHTPRHDVWIDLPYKIGLDTGCVYGNRLSCLDVLGGRLFQVGAGDRRATARKLCLKSGSRLAG